MTIADSSSDKAVCPKCHSEMIYVTAMPHPRAPEMQQTTFVCYPCNRTWNYALSAGMAAAYAASAIVASSDTDYAGSSR
jgi:transposase-like protein